MSRTTFFTAADTRYEMFVLPYIVSALFHNSDARVEVCLQDVSGFRSSNERALDILREHLGEDRILLRGARWAGIPPNSVRFLETPREITKFTYIGDIDILILEAVTDIHLDRMIRHGLPYSNEVRKGRRALSGLHFTRSDAYYPVTVPEGADPRRDEELLYALVTARGWGTPPPGVLRGVHGYHMSPNRAPLPALVGGKRTLDWGLSKPKHFNAYRELVGSPVWQRLVPYFDRKYRLLLGLTDLGVAHHHPEYRLTHGQVDPLVTNVELIRRIVQGDFSPRQPTPKPQVDDAGQRIQELRLALGELQKRVTGMSDALVAERRRATAAEHHAAVTEQSASQRAEIAALRAQASVLEREDRALRETAQALLSTLDKAQTRLAETRVRLSGIAQARKSLRGELQKRGRLLARVRSDLKAAQKRTVDLRRSIRALARDKQTLRGELERDRQTLRAETARNKAALERNRRLEHLLDHLNDGLVAIVTSRRWRWGGALTWPRRVLARTKQPPAAPHAMLRLVSEHRRQRSQGLSESPGTLAEGEP